MEWSSRGVKRVSWPLLQPFSSTSSVALSVPLHRFRPNNEKHRCITLCGFHRCSSQSGKLMETAIYGMDSEDHRRRLHL